jgi:hypothetical protein
MIPARGRIYSLVMIHAFLNREDLAPERCRAAYQVMAEILVE